MDSTINVVELFAGVGGFRLGLENSSPRYKTIWANQWEPGKKNQHAFDCYVSHFGKSSSHVNKDIAVAKGLAPDHDLLVGGFPCQDYSVARTGATGITGKKGVLWWEINDILTAKRPSYVLLENVDRLLKSPASQRGRDFGVILRCLNDLGYAVEWRVINAAEYGLVQRRRRVFIFAFKNTTGLYQNLANKIYLSKEDSLHQYLVQSGFFPQAFPVKTVHPTHIKHKVPTETTIDRIVYDDLATLSANFSACFYNSGIMFNGRIYSEETYPINMPPKLLRDIRLTEPVESRYFLNGTTEKWEYLKGAKKIARIRPNGEPYYYTEGGMCFPDNLDAPARTMLTSESSVNRSTHVIEDAVTGRKRLLTPVECERINGFPDNWTNTGMPEKFRYFTMGNALVVPLITTMGNALLQAIDLQAKGYHIIDIPKQVPISR